MDGFAKVHLVEMQSYREFCVILKFGDLKEKRKDNETKLFIKNRFLVKKKKNHVAWRHLCSTRNHLLHQQHRVSGISSSFLCAKVCSLLIPHTSPYHTVFF